MTVRTAPCADPCAGSHRCCTWADYMNVGMEHGLLRHGRPLPNTCAAWSMLGRHGRAPHADGDRRGTGEWNRRRACALQNAWQFRQILGRGVHGILLCQAKPRRGAGICGILPLSHTRLASIRRSRRRWHGWRERYERRTADRPPGRSSLASAGGRGSETTAAPDLGPVDRGIPAALRSLAA